MKRLLEIISFPFFVAIFLIMIVVLKEVFNLNYVIIFIILLLFLIIGIITILIIKRYFLFILMPFIFLILSLFFIRMRVLDKEYLNACNEILNSTKFIGYVNGYPVYKNGKLSFRFRVIAINKPEITDYIKIKSFDILVKINTKDSKAVKYGDTIVINKKISFAQEKIFDFYYKKFLFYQNIYGICYIKENDFRLLNNIPADYKTQFIKSSIYKIREYIIDNITLNLNEKASGFILSIFLGLRNEMDEDTLSDFRNTGLLHLIAISGMHIGFIGLIFFSIFNIFLSKSKSYFFSIIFLSIYIIMLVPQSSSQRAFIMYCITALFFIIGNKTSGITILSFSCIALLFLNPYSIFDIGFQLSFLATLGILLFSKSIEEKLPHFFPKKLKGIISVTVSAFSSIFLLQWALFRKVAFFSLLSSIIMVPLFEILFICTFFLVSIIILFKIKIFSIIVNILCTSYLKLVELLEFIPPISMIKIPLFISYFSIPIIFLIFYIFLPLILKKLKNRKLLH